MKNRIAIVIAASFVAGGAALGAETIRATFDSVSPGVGCQFSTDSGSSWTGTIAGGMNWTRDNMNPGSYAGLQGNFTTFCIEVTQHVAFGGTYEYFQNTVANGPFPADINFNLPMGDTKAAMLSELFGRYRNSLASNSDYGAFQMSVWEIVYDNGASVSSGVFQIQGAAAEEALANTWLSSLDGSGPMMGGLFALSSREYQDQIVPGPGSLALAGAGGLLAMRRRRVG
ncbi:MAG: hypothetical protein U0573_01180 [Phycisphaerales bacterium]|nr:hypothetical protein [Planctomycetota bacterium]